MKQKQQPIEAKKPIIEAESDADRLKRLEYELKKAFSNLANAKNGPGNWNAENIAQGAVDRAREALKYAKYKQQTPINDVKHTIVPESDIPLIINKIKILRKELEKANDNLANAVDGPGNWNAVNIAKGAAERAREALKSANDMLDKAKKQQTPNK